MSNPNVPVAGWRTFSQQSDRYAGNRPSYPDVLFAWIAECAPARDTALDVATGNGQAAAGLAQYFANVCATDISADQIAHAALSANIEYRVSPAEHTGYPDGSFDAITVAQALHWFDMAAFWQEVGRIARPGALFCAFGYTWPEAKRGYYWPPDTTAAGCY